MATIRDIPDYANLQEKEAHRIITFPLGTPYVPVPSKR